MYDTIRVEVGEGQGYVIAKIHLSVVGEWFLRSFQELSQTLVHQLH